MTKFGDQITVSDLKLACGGRPEYPIMDMKGKKYRKQFLKPVYAAEGGYYGDADLQVMGFDIAKLTPAQKDIILEPKFAPENFYQDGEITPHQAFALWKLRMERAGLSKADIRMATVGVFGKENGGFAETEVAESESEHSSSWKELDALIRKRIKTIWEKDYRSEDEDKKLETLGIMISQYCEWDGEKIKKVCMAAFEDSNFHNATINLGFSQGGEIKEKQRLVGLIMEQQKTLKKGTPEYDVAASNLMRESLDKLKGVVNKFGLGGFLGMYDDILRGITVNDLIVAVQSNEKTINEASVKKVFGEMLDTNLKDAKFTLQNNMDKIIKEAK